MTTLTRTQVSYALETAGSVDVAVAALAAAVGGDDGPVDVVEVGAASGHAGGAQARVTLGLDDATIGADLVALTGALIEAPFDLPQLSGLRLTAVLPGAALAAAVPGPLHGIAGTRALADVPDGPMLGSIIKPSVGLSVAETAERARLLAAAGLDFLKDDELLADQPHAPLERRAEAVARVLEDVALETGRRPIFAFNVSGDDLDAVVAGADRVAETGGRCVMVSLNQVGLAGVLALRRHTTLALHGHRNGWGLLARSRRWGMTFGAYQALWRMAGVDHLHVNGFANKFWEPDASVAASMRACVADLGGVAPALPVVSSGQWGGQAVDQYATVPTQDFMYMCGGGIQGHPDGPAAGVRAVRAAWDAAIAGVPLAAMAADVPALAQSLERFGPQHVA
ncbi:3-oxo-isoapionate-4-phosphate decarboxylase [Baekduia alba]|uniref:RuBisCO large subunit C-terminal-like domain-containing protein n=1 Tax=Baekduia alba TaxID=2997333 RepID=UPI0023419FC2|nr:RuBisCO large subunit C-terminal-like domain-containing protein [Baekduia alba]WCB95329.1 3-oxo-isoapionate-4-phosphate decarboxylase [Baekduia alba]